jgi:hypothetical protein
MNRSEYRRPGWYEPWTHQNSNRRRLLRFEVLERRCLLSAVPAELQLLSRAPIHLENIVSSQALESLHSSAEVKSLAGLDPATQQVLSTDIDWGDGTKESKFVTVSEMAGYDVLFGSLVADHAYAKSGPFRVEPGWHDVTVVAHDNRNSGSSFTLSVFVRDNYSPVHLNAYVMRDVRHDRILIEVPFELPGVLKLGEFVVDSQGHVLERPIVKVDAQAPFVLGRVVVSGAATQSPNREIPKRMIESASHVTELLNLFSDIRIERASASALNFGDRSQLHPACDDGNLDKFIAVDGRNVQDSMLNDAVFAQFGRNVTSGRDRIKGHQPRETKVPTQNTTSENAKSADEGETSGKGEHSDSAEQQSSDSKGESRQTASTKLSHIQVRSWRAAPQKATDEIMRSPPWSRRTPPALIQPDDSPVSDTKRE